jgi:hypothetical protein
MTPQMEPPMKIKRSVRKSTRKAYPCPGIVSVNLT